MNRSEINLIQVKTSQQSIKPTLVIDMDANGAVVINLERSRNLSKRASEDIFSFVTDKISNLLKQGFNKIEVNCGGEGKRFFKYVSRPSRGEQDANLFLTQEIFDKISKNSKDKINITKQIRKGYIFITIETEKPAPKQNRHFNQYPVPVNPAVTSLNSVHIKKEILLEGFGDCGQWDDKFEKALSLLDQGKCVVLKKEDSKEPIIIELKKGENESEVLLDLLGNSEMQCSDILPNILNYILNKGRSVAVDYGDIGIDTMEEYLEDPCSSYNSTLLGVTFYIELRDFGNKHHYILLLKSDSED